MGRLVSVTGMLNHEKTDFDLNGMVASQAVIPTKIREGCAPRLASRPHG